MNTFIGVFTATMCLPVIGADVEKLIEEGKLILDDDFNRDGKYDIANGWSVNNKEGAAKQAELVDGKLVITMAPELDHSTVIRHDAPFDDGVVKLRFMLFDKRGLKLNFDDPAAKSLTWAGHIMRVVIRPGKVMISDDLTGVFDLEVRKKRQDKDLPKKEKEELDKFVRSKQPVFPAKVELKKWHELTVVNLGPKVEVFIDGEMVDEIRIWSLD